MGISVNAETLARIQAAVALVSDGAKQIAALADQAEPSLGLDMIEDQCFETLLNLLTYLRGQGLDVTYQPEIGWQVRKPQAGRRLPWQR